MADKSKKEKFNVEEAAEKSGAAVGKELKKGYGAAKAFGKGAKEAIEKKEKKKE